MKNSNNLIPDQTMQQIQDIDSSINSNFNHSLSQLSYPKLKWLIKTGLETIDKKLDKSVLVIGDTGTGKSTLVNALINKKLESVWIEDNAEFQIKLIKGQEGATIGSTSVSETSLPKSWFDSNTGITYWDCPGFEDTKSIEQDIANGMFIEKVFQNSKEVKIILTMSESQLNSDRNVVILNMAKKFSAFFQDINELKNSMCLVGTKIENPKKNSPVMLQKKFKDAVDDHKNHPESKSITSEVEKFFNIITTPGKVAIFTSPTSEKEVVIDETILKMLAECSYTKLGNINIPISFESRNAITSFADEAKLEAIEVSKILKKNIDIYLKKYINQALISALPNLIKLQKLIDETYNTKKAVDTGSFDLYFNKIEELCNLVGFNNAYQQKKEDLFSWLSAEDKKQALSELSSEELQTILTQNHFKSIVESVNFFKKIQNSNDFLSEFALRDFDGIQKSVDGVLSDKKHQIIDEFSKTFNKSQTILEKYIETLKSNKEQLEKLIKQFASIQKKEDVNYLKEFIELFKQCQTDKKSDVTDMENILADVNEANNLLQNKLDIPYIPFKQKNETICIKLKDIITEIENKRLAKEKAEQDAKIAQQQKEKAEKDAKMAQQAKEYQEQKDKQEREYQAKIAQQERDYQARVAQQAREYQEQKDRQERERKEKDAKIAQQEKEYQIKLAQQRKYEAEEKARREAESKEEKAKEYNDSGCDYHNNKKDYEMAKYYFNKAYNATNNTTREAMYKDNEGLALYCLGKYRDAIACHEIAYNKNPESKYKENQAKAWNELGKEYGNGKKDWQEAAKCFGKAYNLSSDKSKYDEYKKNKDHAESCTIFSVTDINYDNTILNHPEMIKILSKNLSINFAEVIDRVNSFDKDFVLEVCLAGDIELLQAMFCDTSSTC